MKISKKRFMVVMLVMSILFGLYANITYASSINYWDTQYPLYVTRISNSFTGGDANNSSVYPAISADGRYITYQSHATNLVSENTNGQQEIFLYDTQTKTTSLILATSGGIPGNSSSRNPSISGDGRYVTYQSRAMNLVSEHTSGGIFHVFLYDTQTKTTTLVSISGNGKPGNSDSELPKISGDGRYIAYQSYADNLVTGSTYGIIKILVFDTQTKITTCVSVDNKGTQGNGNSEYPSINYNGRYITYQSAASNLVSGDTNNSKDCFLYDTGTKTTTCISVASNGTQGNNNSESPSINSDGRYISYQSFANNLVGGDMNGSTDIFLYDTVAKTQNLISVASDGTQGNGDSNYSSISSDGKYISYQSNANNLVAGDTNGLSDVFLYDTQTKTTRCISLSIDGTQGNGDSQYSAISGDGRSVSFFSKPKTGLSNIYISKAATSDMLNGLTLSQGSISFSPFMTDYNINVANNVTSITVIPVAVDAGASIKVNGVGVTAGTASQAISLIVGTNTIHIDVMAPDGSTATTYTVTINRAKGILTYDANGGSGNVPVSATPYDEGTSVTILDNVADTPLKKTGYIFSGWNTKADGTGTTYAAGNTLFMSAGDVTLYAIWRILDISFSSDSKFWITTYTKDAANYNIIRYGNNTAVTGTTFVNDMTIISGYVEVYNKSGTLLISTANGSSAATSAGKISTGCEVKLYDSAGIFLKDYFVVLKGDIDGDGFIKASDFTKIIKYISTPTMNPLTPIQCYAADVNYVSSKQKTGDGLITSADRTALVRYVTTPSIYPLLQEK